MHKANALFLLDTLFPNKILPITTLSPSTQSFLNLAPVPMFKSSPPALHMPLLRLSRNVSAVLLRRGQSTPALGCRVCHFNKVQAGFPSIATVVLLGHLLGKAARNAVLNASCCLGITFPTKSWRLTRQQISNPVICTGRNECHKTNWWTDVIPSSPQLEHKIVPLNAVWSTFHLPSYVTKENGFVCLLPVIQNICTNNVYANT